MNDFSAISVCPVRSLEVGDLIAVEFLGGITAGPVTGVVYSAYQLTPEQRAYMIAHNIDIPKDEYASIGGDSCMLLFGDFVDSGPRRKPGVENHMFLSLKMNVAVFHPTVTR